MAAVEKMTIALTPEMEAFVRRAVESGEYASTREAIRGAVRELAGKAIDNGPSPRAMMAHLEAELCRQLGSVLDGKDHKPSSSVACVHFLF